MNTRAIIFDLDGTLWDSVEAVTNSWNQVMDAQADVTKHLVTDDIRGIMGLLIEQIGERFFPDLTPARRMEIMDECCAVECDYLRVHGATLFPQLEEMLTTLQKSYRLFIVSNCQNGYLEAFLEAHHMEHFFEDTEHSGNTGLKKGDNIKLIMERNRVTEAIYVGDTQGDCDASREAEIPFVFARYGFGSPDSYDAVIDAPIELLTLVETLFAQ